MLSACFDKNNSYTVTCLPLPKSSKWNEQDILGTAGEVENEVISEVLLQAPTHRTLQCWLTSKDLCSKALCGQ